MGEASSVHGKPSSRRRATHAMRQTELTGEFGCPDP